MSWVKYKKELRAQERRSEAIESKKPSPSGKKSAFSGLNRRNSERNSTQAERFIQARIDRRK